MHEEEPTAEEELSAEERVKKRIAETTVFEKDGEVPVMTESDRSHKSRPANKRASAAYNKSV